MKSILLLVLGAYVVAAVHSVLAFVNKRRVLQRVSWFAVLTGFALHTTALITGWVGQRRFPLFYLPETLSFLAWTLVAAYGLVLYRYRAHALGSFTLPLVAGLTWLLYLLLIIYRSSARWGGRNAAWLGVVGFALVLCTFLGARLMGGYHVFG